MGQNVKQHGQDRRRSKDSRTAEAGGQHREDDGKLAQYRSTYSNALFFYGVLQSKKKLNANFHFLAPQTFSFIIWTFF